MLTGSPSPSTLPARGWWGFCRSEISSRSAKLRSLFALHIYIYIKYIYWTLCPYADLSPLLWPQQPAQQRADHLLPTDRARQQSHLSALLVEQRRSSLWHQLQPQSASATRKMDIRSKVASGGGQNPPMLKLWKSKCYKALFPPCGKGVEFALAIVLSPKAKFHRREAGYTSQIHAVATGKLFGPD